MAKLDRSFVIVRFRLGQENVKGRQRSDNTYRSVMQRIAISFADGKYEEIRNTLKEGVEADIRRELVNMASLYRRHIIGANGNTSAPAGVIRSVIGGAKPLALAAALPAWAPRDAKYVRRKINSRAGTGWFDNRGWQRRPGQTWAPDDTGLLFKEMRADVWEQMFGPISVSFNRDNRATAADVNFSVAPIPANGHVKVQIGTLLVYALGKITPEMLPALNAPDGNIPIASDRGNPGLINLVYQYSPALGKRLGNTSKGRYAKGGKGPYRPTLEPFLSYFLTRSIPAAIQRRITEGSLKRITRSS